MGLDMYLYARRSFADDSTEADTICGVAGVTVEQLKERAALDPYEHETSVYLSRWYFDPEHDQSRGWAVAREAGLADFATPDSQGGTLGWKDGKIYTDITAIYWRKSNAIHAWFVDEVQGGVDECQEGDAFGGDVLRKLQGLCIMSLEAYNEGSLREAEQLLKPRSGFFFGSTDVDEWYAADLQTTIQEIDRVLGAAKDLDVEFVYHSSW